MLNEPKMVKMGV